MSISVLLDIAVAAHPDRHALDSGAGDGTYADLARTARGGAGVVLASGARHVAFLGVNGPAFPTVLFAAAFAGVPVTPLSYRMSPDQLRYLIGELDDPLVVVDEEYADEFVGCGRITITSTDWLAAATAEAEAPHVDVAETAPAVVLFTSGTTSAPKGVILRHRHLVTYVLQTVELGSASDTDAALISVPPYHIAGVATVLSNVYAGRRMIYLPEFTPAGWLGAVRNHGVTHATVVPTMLSRIVQQLDGKPAVAPTLRSIAYGGARMPRPVLERALELFPHVGFVNAYGLTETSSTIAILDADDHRRAFTSDDPHVRARLSSAGRCLPGVEAQIRSESGAPLPPGEPGELWVRGGQISGDYLGRASVLDADGWFPTRDRASIDPDGYLYIEGRADDTIIRGGENIAPAEIEVVLLDHPDVRDVAVVGLPDDEWGQRITAVVVPAPGSDAGGEQLQSWVRSRIRGARTPDEIIFLDDLPYTPTGKLLRRELVSQLTNGSDHDLREESA